MKNYGTLLIIILASSPLLAMETLGMKFRGKTPAKVENNTAAVVAKVRTHPGLDLQKAVLNKDPKKVRSLLDAHQSEVLDQLDDALKLATETAEKLEQKAKEQTFFTELKDPSTRNIAIGAGLSIFGLYTIANGVYVPAEGDSNAHVDWTTLTSNLPTGLASTAVGVGFIYQGITGRTPEKLKRALEIIGMLNKLSQSQSVLEELTKRKSAQGATTKSVEDRVAQLEKALAALSAPTTSPVAALVAPTGTGVVPPADNNSNNQ